MRNILCFTFLSIIFSSCNGSIKNNSLNKIKQTQLVNIEKKIDSKTKKCYIINYYPDSINREYLISINGNERYEQIIQDNMESNFEILQYIDSLGIETIVLNDAFFVFNNDTLLRNKLVNKYFGFILIIKNKYYELNFNNYKKRLEKVKYIK